MAQTPTSKTYAQVPADLKSIDRWLVWKWSKRQDGNLAKVPQGEAGNINAHADENWWPFKRAASTYRSIMLGKKWSDGGGIGFVLTEDDDIGGVDLDGCRDPESGDIAKWAQEIVDLFAPAYCEVSPSGTGLRIFARGAPSKMRRTQLAVEPVKGDVQVSAKDPFIEAYVGKRFLTVTGNQVAGGNELVALPGAWAQLEARLAGDAAKHQRKVSDDEPDLETIQSALDAFSSDDVDRNVFIAIGIALKGELGEDGREIWLDWMAKSEFDEPESNDRNWDGFPDEPDSVGVGTIFYHAHKAGWKHPRSGSESNPMLDILDEVELWHNQLKQPYATVKVAEHHEHLRIGGEDFEQWLQQAFWSRTDAMPKRDAFKAAVENAKGRARFSGMQHATWVRVASLDDKLYLDVGDEAWNVIEIDADGWHIVEEPLVRFSRSPGAQALPTPVRADAAEVMTDLETLIRPRFPNQLKLFIGWQVACLRPDYPIPTLVLAAPPGSAKTSALRAARSTLDPAEVMTGGLPKTEQDLLVSAFHSWVYSADNISAINNDMSDAFCRLVTGGGRGARKLYTDDDVHQLAVKRPAVLTTIGSLTAKPDFISRTISLELRKISADERLGERQVARLLEDLRPRLIGLLLDGASAALRNIDAAESRLHGQLPRMADFAIWVEAAGEAFGWASGEFLEAYQAMLDSRLAETANNDPLAKLIFDWLCAKKDGAVEAPAGEILARLKDFADANHDILGGKRGRLPSEARWFPERARGLADRLALDAELLDAMQIDYSNREHPHSKTRGRLHRLALQRDAAVVVEARRRLEEEFAEICTEAAE